MEGTCNSCNHWEAQEKEDLGQCDVLSQSEMKFVLPVIQNETTSTKIVTKADFGCNQFEA